MGKEVFRRFERGMRYDGDSQDQYGDAYSLMTNFEVNSQGEIGIRFGLKTYTGLGTLPNPGAGIDLVRVFQWDSGIVNVQHNTLMIYQDGNAGATLGEWWIYTNAPEGGDGHAWTALETGITAAYMNPIALNGTVRIATGHDDSKGYSEYLILVNIMRGEATRTYPAGLTIAAANSYTAWTVGAGGKVYKGWLWDYGKLYWSAQVSPTDSTYLLSQQITFGTELTATAGSQYDRVEECTYDLALAMGFDGEDETQIGIVRAYHIESQWISGTAGYGGVVLWVNHNITTDTFNKRISKSILICRRTQRTLGEDDPDYYIVAEWPFDHNLSVQKMYVDNKMLSAPKGDWTYWGGGRPIYLDELSMVYGIGNLDATDDILDRDVAIRPEGFMRRRKRMYAWGIEDDEGGQKIAVSYKDNITNAQPDVFWKLNRIWADGSNKVTHLELYNDRMCLINRRQMWLLDLEQRIQDTYFDSSSYIKHGTDLTRTIVQGDGALFFANDFSIYMLMGSRVEDIAEDAVREVWQAIPAADKANATAAWCDYNGRASYMLIVKESQHVTQEANPPGVPADVYTYCYTVFEYRLRAGGSGWFLHRFRYEHLPGITHFNPRGLFEDPNRQFVFYGMENETSAAAGTPVVLYMDADADDDPADVHPDITGVVRTQWLGTRDDESRVIACDVQRNYIVPSYTANHRVYVRVYGDGLTLPDDYHIEACLPHNRHDEVNLGNIPLQECMLEVEVSWRDDGTEKDRIKQITLYTEGSAKRRTD